MCMFHVQAMHDFVGRCLDKNPNARMRPGELLQHPFLERARDNVYLAHRLLGAAPQQQLRAPRMSSDSQPTASEVSALPAKNGKGIYDISLQCHPELLRNSGAQPPR